MSSSGVKSHSVPSYCVGSLPGDDVLRGMEMELLKLWGVSLDLLDGHGVRSDGRERHDESEEEAQTKTEEDGKTEMVREMEKEKKEEDEKEEEEEEEEKEKEDREDDRKKEEQDKEESGKRDLRRVKEEKDKDAKFPCQRDEMMEETMRKDGAREGEIATRGKSYNVMDSSCLDNQMTDSQMTDSQMTDSQMTDSQMTDSQMTDSQMTDSQMTESHLSTEADSEDLMDGQKGDDKITRHRPVSDVSCDKTEGVMASILKDEDITISKLTVEDDVIHGEAVEATVIQRSKLMNEQGRHLEALTCVLQVKPCDRDEDIWLEGAHALEELRLPVTAELWLKSAVLCGSNRGQGQQLTQGQGQGQEELTWARVLHALECIRTKRIYEPSVKGTGVKVKVTDEGRVVLTERKVTKGGIVLQEGPELSEQTLATLRLPACDHCGLSLAKPEDVFSKGHLANADLQKAIKRFWPKREVHACESCDQVVYCSQGCRRDAWDNYHRVMCPSSPDSMSAMLYDVRKSFRDVNAADGSSWQGWWNAEFSPTMMAKVWSSVMCQARRLANASGKGSPSASDWFTAGMLSEKYITHRQETMTDAIPKMWELTAYMFKRSKPLHYDVTAKRFNRLYHQLASNYTTFHDVTDPLRVFVSKVTTDRKQHKKIGKYFREPLPHPEFHGLFPLVSCCRHSCLPNCQVRSVAVGGRPGVALVACRDILPHEEVLVAYVCPDLARPERLTSLLKKYNITCRCLKCQFEGDGPDVCSHCGKTAGGESGATPLTSDQGCQHETPSLPETDSSQDTAAAMTACTRTDVTMVVKETMASEDLSAMTACTRTDVTMVVKETMASADPATVTAPERDNVPEHENLAAMTSGVSRMGSESQKVTDVREVAGSNCQTGPAAPGEGVRQIFPVCSRCKKAWYCSPLCQKEAWKQGHKKICVK